MTTLLPTKFYLPPTPAGFVARPQLLKLLDEILDHRLTLVSAPAGAGKTTLVSAWVQATHKKGAAFGWLSLDDSDNDLGGFLEYLVTCLDEAGLSIDTAGIARGHGASAETGPVIAEIIRGLILLKRALILILDDYHLIQNKEIHTALEYLIEHAPPHLHTVILTRSDPPFELARLRVRGQLLELRMDQLRFSEEEAAIFLTKATDLQLSASAVSALNTRTEGWIAGLQMAAISMRGRADAASFVTAFTASNRFVFDYLLEQVLNRQPAEVREFLLKTAILERLNAPLCDAVAETGNAARGLLDIIERENLFLIPLDDERGWYRYHHLFASLLRLLLEQNYPGLSRELHHRACHWYEAQDLIPEALQHGLAAGDMELVANIISENVLALVDHAEIAPILTKIDAISDEQRATLPWLEVAYAWGLAYSGQNDKAGQTLALAEQMINALPKDKRAKALGHIAAVQAYLAWTHGDQSSESMAWAEKALSLLPEDEAEVRALNLTTLGNALSQKADDARAASVLEQALELAWQAGQSHVVMQATSGLAFTYVLLGKSRQAQAVCETALTHAELYQRQHNRPLPAAASVHAMLSRVWLEIGEYEKALRIAQRGMALAELWGQVDTIMMCAQYLIYALAFTNHREQATEMIQRMRKIAQQAPPWHTTTLDYVELQIYLDSGPENIAKIHQELTTKHINALRISPLIEARALIKKICNNEALALLKSEHARLDELGDYRKIWLFILTALAYFQQHEQSAALNSIKQALTLAEPLNWITLFIREGPAMERLLRLAKTKAIAPEFVQHLLDVFEARRKHKPELVRLTQALIEPLSERELEVLQHLNSHLSTPEIADLLVVSANTVRTHIKNIYGKLGVHGRSGAVHRARELSLLA